ncbi:I78 family peptidase inhibitor [Sphingomonas sp. HF-S3]|uniref:I78 family peptidase inhibitor n=1 Tax=Sphingomonas rustica TaxID=3103142 RepID=A0ABV0BBL5_9SPHN
MIRIALPLAAVTLMGCTPVATRPEPGPAVPPAALTPCGAEKVSHYVGKTRSASVEREVARLSGAKAIRWIAPGMAVTMDYREDRLNVDVDDNGVITAVRCS